MRAVAVQELQGRPERVEVRRPEPGEGEVLVRVEAAGLNPLDWKIADGMLEGVLPYAFPMIMGVDFAGVVEDSGPHAGRSRRFRPGDPVYGQVISDPVGGGTYTEYVVVEEASSIAAAPTSVPTTVAAGAPTAGMTALGIMDAASLREYESLLVIGAAGGVGTFLTQLASTHDLRVIASTHGHDQRRMAAFGAAVTLDAREHPVAEGVPEEYPDGVDALVDLASATPAEFAANAALVRDGGVALSTMGNADLDALYAKGVEGINFQLTASADLLVRLGQEIDSGRVVVPIENEVPLDQAPDAVARARAGGSRGKTVFTP